MDMTTSFSYDHTFLEHLSDIEKTNYVNGYEKSFSYPTDYPLVILPLFHNGQTNTIRHFIIHGYRWNQSNLKGLCLIHIITLFVFYDFQVYIEHLEYLLKMGASPNQKTHYRYKSQYLYMNALELFEFLLSDVTITTDFFLTLDDSFRFLSHSHIKTPLTSEQIFHVYLLFYTYEVDIYVVLESNPCHSLQVQDITLDMLQKYACLRRYLSLYWKIPHRYHKKDEIPTLFHRHNVLTKYYTHIQYPRSFTIQTDEHSIYVQSSFCENPNEVPPHEYYRYQSSSSSIAYFFHIELLTYIIQSGVNPYSNDIIPVSDRIPMLLYLETYGYSTFHSKRHSNYPFLFSQTLHPPSSDSHYIIPYLSECITTIYPYTSFLQIARFAPHEIYYVSLLWYQYHPQWYRPTNNLSYLLLHILYSFQTKYTEHSVDFISQSFDDLYSDIQRYRSFHTFLTSTTTSSSRRRRRRTTSSLSFSSSDDITEHLFEFLLQEQIVWNESEFKHAWESLYLIYRLHYQHVQNPLLLLN